MLSIEWGKAKAEQDYLTYIGRSGCKPCTGIEVATDTKYITLAPYGVDNCQINVPNDSIDQLIAMLQEAKEGINEFTLDSTNTPGTIVLLRTGYYEVLSTRPITNTKMKNAERYVIAKCKPRPDYKPSE